MQVNDYLAELAEHARQQSAALNEYLIETRREQAKLAGIKPMRFRFRVPVVSNAITATDTGNFGYQGPEQGWLVSVRKIVITGLTASASAPDTVNLINTGTGETEWQLNGNVFAQTFGKGELVLLPGENLILANVGSIAAAGPLTVFGRGAEYPAEKMGELYA